MDTDHLGAGGRGWRRDVHKTKGCEVPTLPHLKYATFRTQRMPARLRPDRSIICIYPRTCTRALFISSISLRSCSTRRSPALRAPRSSSCTQMQRQVSARTRTQTCKAPLRILHPNPLTLQGAKCTRPDPPYPFSRERACRHAGGKRTCSATLRRAATSSAFSSLRREDSSSPPAAGLPVASASSACSCSTCPRCACGRGACVHVHTREGCAYICLLRTFTPADEDTRKAPASACLPVPPWFPDARRLWP